MSSPTKAPVERRHRAAALLSMFPSGNWGPLDLLWIDRGERPDLYKKAGRIAQALVDLEASAYARGLADGAERERAAVVAYQRRTCCLAQAFAIEAGKHLGVNTDG